MALQGGSPVLDVPISADDLPNVYIGLSVIAPADSNRGGQPAFRQGYVPLQGEHGVEGACRSRSQPSAGKLHPRDTVTYTITTRDADRPAGGRRGVAGGGGQGALLAGGRQRRPT